MSVARHTIHHHSGFSLVELSIVLVILGLLTGGILAGQNLIRAAELRSVLTEAQQYSAAAHGFLDQHGGLPGDLKNATSYWGDYNAYCPDAAITNGTPGVCNGNGDGTINRISVANAPSEMFGFWSHLANAGFIEGSYTGLSGPSTAIGAVGIDHTVDNSPRSKLTNAGWSVHYQPPNNPGNSEWFDNAEGGNQMTVGTVGVPGGGLNYRTGFKPDEAWSLDNKADDGQPARGGIRTWHRSNCTNPSGVPSALDAVYNVSNSANVCALWFHKPF